MGAYVRGGSWLTVPDGCPVEVKMLGSNEAYLSIGEVSGGGMSSEHELNFEFGVFKELVEQAVQVLAEMEAKTKEEKAEHAGRRAAEQEADTGRSA